MIAHFRILCKTKFRHRVELTFSFNGKDRINRRVIDRLRFFTYNLDISPQPILLLYMMWTAGYDLQPVGRE